MKSREIMKKTNFGRSILLLSIIMLHCFFLSSSMLNAHENPSPKPFPHIPRPFFSSHRGSRFLTPENTMQAFQQILALGTSVLEFDVRLTKDHQLVVFHDAVVNRTTDGENAVNAYTLQEIKKLNAAFHFRDHTGEYLFRTTTTMEKKKISFRVSTLEEIFLEFWGEPRELTPLDINMNIEIKDNDLLAAELLLKLLEKYGNVHEHVVIVSNFCTPLEFIQQNNKLIPTGTCEKEVVRFVIYHTLNDLTSPLFELGKLVIGQQSMKTRYSAFQIPVSHLGLNFSNPYFISDAKQTGKEVHYWVVNSKESMRQLIKAGADGIITDRTDLALEVWKEMNLPLSPIVELYRKKYSDHLPHLSKPYENFEEIHSCVTLICRVIDSLKFVVLSTLFVSLLLSYQLCCYCCKLFTSGKAERKTKVD
ncbi:hypothetical protein C9374_004860 [Naegleria lovaniensis]|uniref:GP-PDE domain-containing protein n=1 Tax=Naegleria lovaniensis TaxID=51637 RepID=A0AA88KKE3_NAELO|nr:uncharacterized protein C9374_004860 [Naegleria lovaniensis]KAG2382893.1 hypothetical protein C9374_004860 [Naegleria lovaniensis]